MNEHITIRRKTKEEDLYVQLQERSLKDVQRLAGGIWTDYNLHDPGVTIMDVLNYALLETDYRLRFDLPDYLALPNRGFSPVANALFAPSDVFPVNPVTEMDYRKLLVSTIDDLAGVKVITHLETGIYDFVLDAQPDTSETRKERMVEEVRQLFHAQRNLCETIGEVRFVTYEPLLFCAEIEIDETEEVDRMMALIYLEAQEFLSGGVRFRRVDELLAQGWTLDEILEGPVQKRMVVDEDSLLAQRLEYDISFLYQRIKALPGVCQVTSLAFQGEKEVYHDTLRVRSMLQAYSIVPYDVYCPTVSLTKKGKRVEVHAEVIGRLLYSLRSDLYGAQNRTTDKEALQSFPKGTYRDLFMHIPVGDDLPDCYGVNERGLSAQATPGRKEQARLLTVYLDLFDHLIYQGLNELKALPRWMCPDAAHLDEKKEIWMDLLDQMYGEDSDPIFLRRLETDQERRERRISFLSRIPEWGRDRGRGRNLLQFTDKSTSGIEDYMDCLLRFSNYAMEMFVVEHLFFVDNGEPFRCSIVLTAEDQWLQDAGFRRGFEEIVFRRMPAHLRVRLYWQRKERVGEFRSDYQFWRYALSTPRKMGLAELSEKLKNKLEDEHYWYCTH